MPDMVSTILIDFRVLAVPSEADIMEKIVRYYLQMQQHVHRHRTLKTLYANPQTT